MEYWSDRTELLLGKDKTQHLRDAHVLVVGVGGVGAYAAEMLCRTGVGTLTLVDADTVQPTNINRQLPATHSTIGRPKVEVLAERFRDINPDIKVNALPIYIKEEDVEVLLLEKMDFIVDAIDTIAPKCALITEALRRGIPIVSSMGAGAKSDITQIRFADLWDTYHCGLAKAVRTRLKKEGLRRALPVVFSTEQADRRAVITIEGTTIGASGLKPLIMKQDLYNTSKGDGVVPPYRIPGITTAYNGRLITAAARLVCGTDPGYGQVDVVCRTSDDHGDTWSDMIDVAVGNGKTSATVNYFETAFGDPAIVGDRTSSEVLIIAVAGCTVYGNGHTTRQNPNMIATIHSTDNGDTWGKPVNVTEDIIDTFIFVFEQSAAYLEKPPR